MQNDTQNIIGVDVGSGSVRAGVFNLRGELLAHATREITLFRSAGNKVEQSSREIWQAVCYCIKTAVASAGVSPSSIAAPLARASSIATVTPMTGPQTAGVVLKNTRWRFSAAT